MHANGLAETDTVFDVGSGWGEFGHRLATGRYELKGAAARGALSTGSRDPSGIRPSRARYVPVDAAIDGTDLEHWTPPRHAEWFVCLEVLEHLRCPSRLMVDLTIAATKGVIVSTPNCRMTDVLGMDSTHKTIIRRAALELAGFEVSERSFYGTEADSLFAVWTSGN